MGAGGDAWRCGRAEGTRDSRAESCGGRRAAACCRVGPGQRGLRAIHARACLPAFAGAHLLVALARQLGADVAWIGSECLDAGARTTKAGIKLDSEEDVEKF